MTSAPAWLPDLISVDGDPFQVIQRLYMIFEKDFKINLPLFRSQEVWYNRKVEAGQIYEEGFWHLITRLDYSTQIRLLDPWRAEKLPWCAPSITHSDDPILIVWDYKEGNKKVRTYLWLKEFDYVIILEKKKMKKFDIFFLVTAYHIDGERSKRNLQKKFLNRFR